MNEVTDDGRIGRPQCGVSAWGREIDLLEIVTARQCRRWLAEPECALGCGSDDLHTEVNRKVSVTHRLVVFLLWWLGYGALSQLQGLFGRFTFPGGANASGGGHATRAGRPEFTGTLYSGASVGLLALLLKANVVAHHPATPDGRGTSAAMSERGRHTGEGAAIVGR